MESYNRDGVSLSGQSCFLIVDAKKSRAEIIEDLQRIRGVGEKMAEKMYEKGIRSIRDAMKAPWVSEAIRLCARYIGDIEKVIPTKAVEALVTWLEVLTLDAGIKDKRLSRSIGVIPVGGYRRGKESSHDIDILMTYSGDDKTQEIGLGMEALIKGYPKYRGTLSLGTYGYDFLLELDGAVRVIEIYFSPDIERGSSLLHYTGPKEFGVAIRQLAKAKGMKFSQHGLVDRETNDVKARETEKLIFEALDLKYIAPESRGDPDVIKEIYSKAAHLKDDDDA